MRINEVTQIDEGWFEKLAGHAIGKKTGIDPYQMYLLGKTVKDRKNTKKLQKNFATGNFDIPSAPKKKPVKKRRYNQDVNAPEPYDTREPFVSNREPYDSRER
jgi:hypothetical protein|tara:strand:+ start:22102 stop:22410 length:309 start_codon:yes stop_codon:yes gene_type:complete